MRWILSFLKPLKGRLIVGTTVKIIGTVAELIIPFLLSHILENVIEKNSVKEILFYGVLMVLCALVACVGNVVANRMAAKTTMFFATRMRKELFSSTLSLTAESTDRFTIPSLESRITSDTYNVQNFVGMMQRMGIRAPILLLGGAAITLLMDVKLALVMICMMPIIFVIVYSVSRLGVPLYTTVQKSVDGMVRVVREDAQGIRVIKALSKVEFENARYDRANMALRKNETRAGIIMGVVNPIMTLLMNLGIVAVVAAAAFLVQSGESSSATVIAFMQYFTLISMAMMSISRMFVMYTKCAASAKRISEVLTTENELEVIEDDGKGNSDFHIEFEKVSFSYLHKKDNLKNIKEELTAMFGAVFQNDFIYADTVEENIRFGRDIPLEDIVSAAKTAQAHEFISSLCEGYSYPVTTGGTNLSGGQRQRLLISRAIAGKPEILVLDDSSSALDYKTDAALRAALAKDTPESTVITVAQRVSSVKNCDLILVIDEGEIIGAGQHEYLLETCSEYKEISDSQMGGAFLE